MDPSFGHQFTYNQWQKLEVKQQTAQSAGRYWLTDLEKRIGKIFTYEVRIWKSQSRRSRHLREAFGAARTWRRRFPKHRQGRPQADPEYQRTIGGTDIRTKEFMARIERDYHFSWKSEWVATPSLALRRGSEQATVQIPNMWGWWTQSEECIEESSRSAARSLICDFGVIRNSHFGVRERKRGNQKTSSEFL